jgi:hypothetical protein
VWLRWLAGFAPFVVATGPSLAEPAETPRQLQERIVRTVLFGSAEVAHSPFGSFGFKRSLSGNLDRPGFLLMGGIGYGRDRERDRDDRFDRHKADAHLLIGHQWTVPGGVVALFGGVELDHEHETMASGAERRTASEIGGRLQFELWLHPTERTLVTTTLIAGSARNHLWGRQSFGWRIADAGPFAGIFIGPEVSGYATETYQDARFGLHATGIPLGPLRLRLSGGLTVEEGARPGAYLALSGYWRL